ncbi:MAG TPA: hypothetical protein VN083_07935, partial [Vicinamibacteria bacterium]|nr:hypothetical protein [Vicinamibacteria bacterium]
MGFWAALLLAPATVTRAATPPSPAPPPVQDQLDLQARSDVLQGSGARAFGMGGAFLARADDATAASWNPAGLSYLREPEISGVFTGAGLTSHQVFPCVQPCQGTPEVDQRRGSTPDFFAAAYPFEWGSLSGAGQLSFQRVVSFSNHRTFTNIAGATFNVRSSGGFDVLALGTGVQAGHRLRLGATLNHWFNGYSQNVDKQSPVRAESIQTTDFNLSGWNANGGLIFNPWESLNVGVVVKTPFWGSVDLRQARTDGPVTQPTTNSSPKAGDMLGPVSLHFPGAVGLGLSWRPRSALTLS